MSETVLVTGSSRGIGAAIALQLAKDNYDLVLHCRSSREQVDNLKSRINDLGRTARVLQFDISDRAQCADILQAVPGMRRLDGTTVEVQARTMAEAYALIRLMYKYIQW